MNSIDRAMLVLHAIDREAGGDGWMQAIHPVSKLLVTLVYLVTLLSFGKYALAEVLVMGIYLIVLFLLGEVSVRMMCGRLWIHHYRRDGVHAHADAQRSVLHISRLPVGRYDNDG